MTEENKEALFKAVRYYIIGRLEEEIEKLLLNGQAKEESYLSGLATHALVTDYDNVEVEEAKDVWQIPVITPRWVELSSKCNQLLPIDAFTPSNSQLFSGMVVCPSQLTKHDRDILWALITFYGGQCKLQLDKTCTHLIVPKPNGKKYDEARKHPENITIVTPDWVTDSVNSKSLQNTKKYDPILVILAKEKSPEKEIQASEEIVPNTQESEASSDIIASSFQNMNVSSAQKQPGSNAMIVSQQAFSNSNPNAMPPHLAIARSESVMSTPAVAAVFAASAPTTASPKLGTSVTTLPMQMDMPLNQFQAMGQTIISQPGQVIMAPHMMHQQMQFQMQRPITTGGSARFSVPTLPQRFSAPNQPNTTRQSTQSPRKATTKRRRSSSKSKNATSPAASGTIPSSPVHSNQMNSIMMSPQHMQNNMLQQNQQMLNQHRMIMMQGGQPGQANFMQQQMLQQQQHMARMQGKGQVTPTSPQKMTGQQMIGNQTSGVAGMRPGFAVNFQNSTMRMQQHAPRQMQNQAQLSPQMMAMGFNPQMQVQQQQVKMSSTAGLQPPQQQFIQQQPGMVMPMTVPLQNQQQVAAGGAKMQQQPQRMQVSPQQQQQQQAMFMHQHGGKQPGNNMSPRLPMQQQQHSPMIQQQQAQGGMNQQQQLMMQQMVMQQQQQQLHMQQQQQLMQQRPNNMQQKLTTPPSSHAPVNVGVDVISPTALQQGLMLAQAQQNQAFQQPLIHPSLQTPPQEFGKAQQGGSSKSRRSKSRRKDGDENVEGKPKPRSRGGRQKKSAQSPASSPATKKLLSSPGAGSMVGRNAFSPMMRANHPMGYYPTTMNVMTPPPHPTVPVAFSVNKQCFPSPTATASPLAATENTYGVSHLVAAGSRMVPPPQTTTPKVETHFLVQHTPTPTPPPPHRGPFNDPLALVPKSYEGHYFGHDPAENVPQELCLLGCVFVIVEYEETVPDVKIIEHWKKVISLHGGIVEEEYNTCTCTHLLCVSQSTPIFRDSLLDGKRCVTVYWLNDTLQVRELRPPWLALHIPSPYPPTQKPAVKHTISYTGFHQKERERLKMMAGVCGAKFSGFLSRSNTVLICKGTVSLKYDKAREWRIPCVNMYWLRDVMHGDVDALNNPNQPKYQNFDETAADNFSLDESKMQQILDPWKVPVRVTLDCMQRARVKRKNSVNDSAAATPALKRSRVEGSYQPLPRVCFTGFSVKQVSELQKSLESLQGQVSKTISHSTHLVAKYISRTRKFLCAISVCQYIVTPEWIEDSSKSNWLLDEDKYLLHDKSAEEKFQFSLKESISRARKKQLFKGYLFCVTENVTPDRATLTEIIECAGGKVMDKVPAIPILKRLKLRKPPNNRLLLISCPTDEQQVVRWKSEGISVHNAEIILSGVLKQEISETLYQL